MEKTKDNRSWEAYWSGDHDHSWWKRPDPHVLEFISTQSPERLPHVLDLGSGLGRHAIAFAQAGFLVSATDASESAVSHRRKWAADLSLRIPTQVCDVLGDSFPDGSFDLVLSYNVIYHGSRNLFAAVIDHVHALLRTGGLFYFTRPTRADGKYGFGEEVALHTYHCERSITPGGIHYFADKADLEDFLSGFRRLSMEKEEAYWSNRGVQQFYSTCHVLAETA
ncbi:MAG: class I SAM-dependent methyltransferase [Candidatus Eisenbacteria sp.]|nr:class I SAM-dependent methyltransferase [Candidatus Eisenbacteria bacterium]